ncbi:serine hydrolase [Kribbella sp. CA-293567]|uniref:serine hydrolase n=1 Tax=Kribbella sp. CA-293567 TaxID=3002436 RepID=UPI0022DD326D|nr:LpqB family beta-propeller domain-containing protein [Kribbella sp. CA-293567]WBQ07524.1 serine hydrolase [Kribbella sp. CA-293567]
MTRRPRIEDLTELAVPEQPALSPDGTQVAYVLRTTDLEGDRTMRSLWRVPTSGGEPQQLTRGESDLSPVWSPDGSQLAFLRAKDGPAQLWVLPIGGGEPEQFTTLPLGAGTPRWSPDGSRIAFSAPVDIADSSSDSPIVTERLDYQADGAGWLRTMRNHVHLLEVGTKKCRQATEGDWHAGDPAWSPDGSKLAFGAATAADTDLNPTAPAYVLDATDEKAEPQLAGLAEGLVGPVTWTADGDALVVVGNPAGPVGHAALLRLWLGNGDVLNLGESLDRNVVPGGPAYPGALPALTDDGRAVLFAVRDRGCSHLYSVPVDGGTPKQLLGEPGQNVSGLTVAGGTAALVLTTQTSYGEIATLDLASGEATTLTAYGEKLGDVEHFAREEREFTVSDGTVVAGYVIRDPAVTGPQPLLLDIHGGPHNAWNAVADEVHFYHQELAARGWIVLLMNPRGSDGYGEAFYNAALGGWGTADAKDFLEPLDELVAEGIADPQRLAVAGYSYGGFMTCYLTSRDDRFAAAVTGGVVSDLASMAGTSDSGHYLSAYELNGPGDFSAMSPFSQVDQVKTPTLVLHGDADVRCPVGQAQQWHTALREQGVPTQLVLYPEASHLFIVEGRPSHRLDFNRRIVDWVEQYAGDANGPRRARIDAAHWQRRLTTLAAKHGVPGATLGILRLQDGVDEELVEAATGVLLKETGVEVTTDSLFQIGSMSKVWTATLAMQLVDEGLLELDAPLVEVLPELRLGDPDVAKQVTMRHLLTHTSGIDGDVFTDTGRGDDCLEKYVDGLAEVGQNHPLGVTWSYCNSGFSLAGRVIEKLTGKTWDEALRERLIKPLGLGHTVTLPEEALLHRAAVGHVGESPDELTKAPVWGLPRSLGPAGLIVSTAADALAFARLHLKGGVAPDGTQVLRQETVELMAEQHAELPDKYSLGDSWGLGWIRFGWDGQRLIGHDGNTIGQAAFLRVLPAEKLAVTLLTNGGNSRDLYEELYREIFRDLAGLEMPSSLTPPAEPPVVEPTLHVGRYERAATLQEIFVRDGDAVLRTTVTGPLAELMPEPSQEFPLVPVDGSGDLFVMRPPGSLTWIPVTFYSLPTGEKYLHCGVRATPKVG